VGKKQPCPEFENHERWLISFADMLTLLFATFVVLYALEISGKKNKSMKMSGSIQESFNRPLQDIPIDLIFSNQAKDWGIFDHVYGNQLRPPKSQKFPGNQPSVSIIDSEMKRVQIELEDRLYGHHKFRNRAKPGHQRVVSVHRVEEGFLVRLLARGFFLPGSAKINKNFREELDEVISILKGLARPITLEGHTDSLKPKSPLTNWELSSLRAGAVLRYMVNIHHFKKSFLSIAGYADQKPVAHNGSSSGRQLNRRIDIHVHYDSESKLP